MSDCTEVFGRKNELGSPPEMLLPRKSAIRPEAYRDTVETPFRLNSLPTACSPAMSAPSMFVDGPESFHLVEQK